MDEADSSWVRRTRFSQSIVRSSSSGKGERFGAFVRGTAPRHDGFDFRHSERKLKHTSSDSQLNRERRTGDRSSSRQQGASSAKQDSLLNSDVPRRRRLAVRLPSPAADQEKSPPDATGFWFHSEEQKSLRLQRACSSPAPLHSLDAPVENDNTRVRSCASFKTTAKLPSSKPPKRRAKSPIPTRVVISDVFKEAKAATKRFSSPQKQRKSSSPRSSPDDSPPFGFASLRTPSKLKITSWRGTSSWPIRNPGNGLMAKVSASKMLERWMVDRSQLLIGHRFASGAYSRLFHGIYKEEPVAVKFIRLPDDGEDDELSARLEKQFTSELTILATLQHRNIIKLVGACNCPPVLCVITEFLSGGSLRAFLRKQECKTLPLEKVISISLDIARGLEYIHLQGVVHRDVKPENILFDGEFCAKVVDFGVACEEAYCNLIDDDPGTYRWMAPEMYKHKPYGRKVDVYSFGILLWELVTGSLPYEYMAPVQAAFAVVHKNLRPVIPSSCPPPLRLLIEQCWSSQPGKRPEFREIVQILENLKTVLDRDGTLDKIPSSARQAQECSDQNKKKLANWLQKLSYDQPDFSSGPPPPKLL